MAVVTSRKVAQANTTQTKLLLVHTKSDVQASHAGSG
jgi:hypothetical protein